MYVVSFNSRNIYIVLLHGLTEVTICYDETITRYKTKKKKKKQQQKKKKTKKKNESTILNPFDCQYFRRTSFKSELNATCQKTWTLFGYCTITTSYAWTKKKKKKKKKKTVNYVHGRGFDERKNYIWNVHLSN